MRVAFGVLAGIGVSAAMLITAPPQSTVAGVPGGVPRQVLLRPDSGNGNGEPQDKPHSGQKAVPELEAEVFGMTNNERVKAGVPKLREDEALHVAAQNH